MKKLIIIFVLLLFFSTVHSQHDQFRPIEIDEFEKLFSVHTKEEGPGMDNFGMLYLRIHVTNSFKPVPVVKEETSDIKDIIKISSSKFNMEDYTHKFIFSFKSNAPWKKENARVSFYINKYLYEDYLKEIKDGDEVWLFVLISSFNTFSMTGYGRLFDFLSKDIMINKGLIK